MIRPVQPLDTAALIALIDATQLFPGHMLEGMLQAYFATEDGGNQRWLTYDDGKPAAVAYCAPEPMTSGTCNLYLIAVHPHRQRQGIGAEILAFVERDLIARGQRILLIETSSLAKYAGTRTFYQRCGYEQESRFRDFYAAGEDKLTFRKSLLIPSPL